MDVVDVYVRSNPSRDIRLPHFVRTNDERTIPAYAGHRVRPKRHLAICLKLVSIFGDDAEKAQVNELPGAVAIVLASAPAMEFIYPHAWSCSLVRSTRNQLIEYLENRST